MMNSKLKPGLYRYNNMKYLHCGTGFVIFDTYENVAMDYTHGRLAKISIGRNEYVNWIINIVEVVFVHEDKTFVRIISNKGNGWIRLCQPHELVKL